MDITTSTISLTIDSIVEEFIEINSTEDSIIPIYQYKPVLFHKKCLQSNSNEVDSTGLRLHGGSLVGIRFLSNYLLYNSDIFPIGCKVCELGCGTGIFGLIGTNLGQNLSILTLTDGNDEAVELAKRNYERWKELPRFHNTTTTTINFSSLLWGIENQTHLFLRNMNQGDLYDILLGSELMYYRTDMQELMDTVKWLLHDHGLFIHTHVIRRYNQGNELTDVFEKIGWKTIEVYKDIFIDPHEFCLHPDWHNVRCLISGNNDIIDGILNRHSDWKIFKEEQNDDINAEIPSSSLLNLFDNLTKLDS